MSNVNSVEIRIPVPWGYVAGCWYGDLNERPILALHGWLDNAGSFARLAPLIAPHCPVLAIDLPGHGRSSHYPSGFLYHVNDYVRLIHRIALHYKWPKISLLAHSLGACIGFYYASMFPKMVDMIIAIDFLSTRQFPPHISIALHQGIFENSFCKEYTLTLEQRQNNLMTYEFLTERLYFALQQSVYLENCKYLLDRSVIRSEVETDKFYLCGDSRLKLLQEFYTEPALVLAMAQQIKNVNYFVIKAGNSEYLNLHEAGDTIAQLRANNRNFELHILADETHHVHLNNPNKVAQCLVRYIRKYRGPYAKIASKI